MITGKNWLISMGQCLDFYAEGKQRRRADPGFPWKLVDGSRFSPIRLAKSVLSLVGYRNHKRREWLNTNSELLWESRSLLNDEVSRHLFDQALMVRLVGHGKFYFPRTEFDDLIEILGETPFLSHDLPKDYLGLPLKVFDISLNQSNQKTLLRMIVNSEFFAVFNSYRQYLLRRKDVDASPSSGEIVLDCGSCIGDMSLIFAALVADGGEVHTFDPVPLHVRFCHLQASLNPTLAHVLHINELAVGNCTRSAGLGKVDLERIDPATKATDVFSSTTLDDYAAANLSKVDFIKMDVEGAELDTIEGAQNIIREFKPRLAISGYHKPEDLWLIPARLKAINPDYRLYFGHHSPVQWESVFYAVQP